MNEKRGEIGALRLLVILALLAGGGMVHVLAQTGGDGPDCVSSIEAIRQDADHDAPLYERYRDIRVVDIHNHDASEMGAGVAILVSRRLAQWDRYNIDQTALFGSISEPAAIATDRLAFEVFRDYPDRVYPFFAGVPVYEDEGLAIVQENLEAGYFGIGELAAASTYSPVVSNLAWKADHPNDGHLPEIYAMAGRYGVPVLLHIDPPNGFPIAMLELALEENPDTIFIFAHANAYNDPASIAALLEAHDNLWIDFFAGFTAYNADSDHALEDFVPLIEQHPDRFLVGTDSGYGIGYAYAAAAIYELLDLLTPETACRVAAQNAVTMMESQPPTEAQLARIEELAGLLDEDVPDMQDLNKLMAHELVFTLEARYDGETAGASAAE